MSSLAERLRTRIVIAPGTGCHNWTGSKNLKGYGRIKLGRRRALLTHRVAYELVHGPIPEGLVIDHLCRNPACCNPEHLEAVTLLENTRRGNSGLKHAIKTHCPKGHAYTEDNIYRPPRAPNERHCRACIKARTRSEAARLKDNARRRERAAQEVLARGGIPRRKRVSQSGGSPQAAKSDSLEGR